MKTRKKRKLANKKIKKVDKKPKKRGNPTGKGGFQKGRSGNPTGRPKEDPEIKAIREAVKQDLVNAVGWAVKLTIQESKNVSRNELTLLQAGVLKSFRNYRDSGNTECIRYVMDHVIGKAKETVDIEGSGGNINFVIGQDYFPVISNGDSTDSKS